MRASLWVNKYLADPNVARVSRHLRAGCPGFSSADLDRLFALSIDEFIVEYVSMLDGENRSRGGKRA